MDEPAADLEDFGPIMERMGRRAVNQRRLAFVIMTGAAINFAAALGPHGQTMRGIGYCGALLLAVGIFCMGALTSGSTLGVRVRAELPGDLPVAMAFALQILAVGMILLKTWMMHIGR